MPAEAITVYKELIVAPILHILITSEDPEDANLELEPHERHISIVDTYDRSVVNISIDQLPLVIASLTKLHTEVYNGTTSRTTEGIRP